jgi:hypothetical protein
MTLSRYGILGDFKRVGSRLVGPCPYTTAPIQSSLS